MVCHISIYCSILFPVIWFGSNQFNGVQKRTITLPSAISQLHDIFLLFFNHVSRNIRRRNFCSGKIPASHVQTADWEGCYQLYIDQGQNLEESGVNIIIKYIFQMNPHQIQNGVCNNHPLVPAAWYTKSMLRNVLHWHAEYLTMTACSKVMFSSCSPTAALVDGVNRLRKFLCFL